MVAELLFVAEVRVVSREEEYSVSVLGADHKNDVMDPMADLKHPAAHCSVQTSFPGLQVLCVSISLTFPLL